MNKNGRRFTDETVQHVGDESVKQASLSLMLERQPYKTCYLIFDKPVADIFNKWPDGGRLVLQGIGEVSGIGGWALVDDLIVRQGTVEGRHDRGAGCRGRRGSGRPEGWRESGTTVVGRGRIRLQATDLCNQDANTVGAA